MRETVVDFNPIVVGFARTLIVQVPLAAKSEFEQESDKMVKFVVSPIVGALHDVATPVPELVKVKVCDEELLPKLIPPKNLNFRCVH